LFSKVSGRLEFGLAGPADGADPRIGNALEGGAGGDAFAGITLGRIVFITADVANVFLHEKTSLNVVVFIRLRPLVIIT